MARILRINKIQTTWCISGRFKRKKNMYAAVSGKNLRKGSMSAARRIALEHPEKSQIRLHFGTGWSECSQFALVRVSRN